MVKVIFLNPDGDELNSRDMPLDQLYALKQLADTIDIDIDSYALSDVSYNVDVEQFYVWLRKKVG